jgi:predicted Rossmann-fold nucleotide-binding protein
MHDKPVVMLDPFGHYDGLLAWLYGLVDSGYVAQGALDRLVVVDDVDAAMARCAPRGSHSGGDIGPSDSGH